MLRGYLDEFQIAGAKNATQQIRNPSRSTYAKRVFISGRGPTAKNKREECYDYMGALTSLRDDFNLVFTRSQSQDAFR